jgi:hypothetical protein
MCYTLGWERDKCEVNVSVDVHIGLRVGVRIGTAAIWRNRFRVENPTIENPSVENPSVGNPVVENFAPAGAFDVGCGGTWASSGAEVDRRERGRAVWVDGASACVRGDGKDRNTNGRGDGEGGRDMAGRGSGFGGRGGRRGARWAGGTRGHRDGLKRGGGRDGAMGAVSERGRWGLSWVQRYNILVISKDEKGEWGHGSGRERGKEDKREKERRREERKINTSNK